MGTFNGIPIEILSVCIEWVPERGFDVDTSILDGSSREFEVVMLNGILREGLRLVCWMLSQERV